MSQKCDPTKSNS